MLDQMFTAENFRRIFDSENRKGVNLAKQFFPNLEPLTKSIREKVKELRDLRSKKNMHTPDEYVAKHEGLKEDLKRLKSNKSKAITSELESVSSRVRKPSFKLALIEKAGPKGKSVFCIDGTPETFFVVKQLQHNIRSIYDVKQSNRHDSACKLRDTVASKFPFEIVRTDVASFYETRFQPRQGTGR
jgi:hypothetical protein